MGSFVVSLEGRTVHDNLVTLARSVVDPLAEAASNFATAADLPDSSVVVRVTDNFASEVEARCREESPPYTTERPGGGVAAITLRCQPGIGSPSVLINAAVFTPDDSWTVVHLPTVLAHEVSHCLIELCRRQDAETPTRFEPPKDLLETVDHCALTVCDEYLADELAKVLLPPTDVTVTVDGNEVVATDRVMLAVDSLGQMRDALDKHVYPALLDRVRRYRMSGAGFDDMVDSLTAAIPAALVLSAHYRAAISEFPPTEEAELVAQHPATRLYLQPFWDRVGPVLDRRLDGPLWSRFPQGDREAIDTATEATLDFWAALGLTLEDQGGGRVYVHVDESDDC